MKTIAEILTKKNERIVIAGHVNPDGDCVGSCMALYLYLRKISPESEITVFLEKPAEDLMFLSGTDKIKTEVPSGYGKPDLMILLDASAYDRIGLVREMYEASDHTVCIDHHISNTGIARISHIRPEVGSCAEVLYELMDKDLIDRDIAEAIYTGMVHDTGVFQYTNTSPRTLQVASELIAYGFDFNKIIMDSFYARSFGQTKLLGRCLDRAESFSGNKGIWSYAVREDAKELGLVKSDFGVIVSQLKLVRGIRCAVFAYEGEKDVFKVSLRTDGSLMANEICSLFGGGGHAAAAGCTIKGRIGEVKERILEAVQKELDRTL